MPMHNEHERLVVTCLLLAWLGLGCGEKGGDEPSNTAGTSGASGSSGMTAAGSGDSGSSGMTAGRSGASGSAGAAGSAGSKEPTPPPEMPRDLGPKDGIHCESALNNPPPETCSAGSRCCPNGPGGEHAQVCIAGGEQCPACDAVTCGQLLCDGPEDCPGAQFCCYAMEGSCKSNADCAPADPAAQDSSWISVECQERCVPDLRDPDHGMVACKDDRDCPGPFMAGRCRPLDSAELPFGIKVCFGTGS